jgi:hypothetical protein
MAVGSTCASRDAYEYGQTCGISKTDNVGTGKVFCHIMLYHTPIPITAGTSQVNLSMSFLNLLLFIIFIYLFFLPFFNVAFFKQSFKLC